MSDRILRFVVGVLCILMCISFFLSSVYPFFDYVLYCCIGIFGVFCIYMFVKETYHSDEAHN